MMPRVGLVLAGGAGQRLGRPKDTLRLGGVAYAARAAAALDQTCGEVLISVQPGQPNPDPPRRVVEDAPPAGRGPLAGIAAGFQASEPADLVVLACDYPRVDAGLIAVLVQLAATKSSDITLICDAEGREHPLVALWRRSCYTPLQRALHARQLQVRALLQQLQVQRLGPNELPGFDLQSMLLNVNRPQDLQELADDLE